MKAGVPGLGCRQRRATAHGVLPQAFPLACYVTFGRVHFLGLRFLICEVTGDHLATRRRVVFHASFLTCKTAAGGGSAGRPAGREGREGSSRRWQCGPPRAARRRHCFGFGKSSRQGDVGASGELWPLRPQAPGALGSGAPGCQSGHLHPW